MRLILTRNQAKKVFGGVSFEVKGQVELTPEESGLIDHYNLTNQGLFSEKMVSFWGQPTDVEMSVRVRDLLHGDESFKCKDLGEVIAFSESLKSACSTLKAYLGSARSFGSNEAFDY